MADDPLLTIDDAVREYWVSPKTVRRRLRAGEIPGAYKRPGPQGPEWVFTQSALEEAGFVPRPDQDEVPNPDGPPEEQADYWRDRAVGAEAALAAHRRQTARDATDAQEPEDRGGRRGITAVAVVLLGIAVMAGTVIALESGGSDAPEDPVMAVVAEVTEPGDEVGLVGSAAAAYLPDDRVPVRLETEAELAGAPRFVITAASSAGEQELVDRLEQRAGVTVAVDRAQAVRVFDRGMAPAGEPAAEPAPEPVPAPTAPPTPDAPPVTSGGPEAPEGPEGPPRTPLPSAGERTAATVEPGDHFWSLAEDRLTSELGRAPTDAEVAPYWQSVVDANQDILIEPGNPDLLHVGQVIQLPPP